MGTRGTLAVVRVSAAGLALLAVASILLAEAARGMRELSDALSFFTVQSNLIGAGVLLYAASRWRRQPTPLLDWLRGAAVVYLLLTMVVYNVLLADGQPMTWTNAVVHVLFPLYLALDWVVDPPWTRVGWARALLWVTYPTAYLAYTFMRGTLVGWYPYPFLDLRRTQPETVALSVAALYAVGLVLIAAVGLVGDRRAERRRALVAHPAAEDASRP